MKIVVVGSPEDVRGFALAGLAGYPADGRLEVETILAERSREDSDVGLLLVSGSAARQAPEALAALRKRDGAPIVLELPEGVAR